MGLLHEPGIVDHLAIGRDQKLLDPHVNPDRVSGARQRFKCDVDTHNGVIPAIRFL